MGRRKTKAPTVTRASQQPIPTVFNCPFCNHEKSVSCTMDKQRGAGAVQCSVCDAKFTTRVHALMEPVDVYTKWLDACQAENDDDEGEDEFDDV